MKTVLAIILVVLILFLPFISLYNRLVSLREGVDEKWAQVETQLQRRLDLIPNLVETVKGYAAHEKEVFENIAAARAKLSGARTREEIIEGNRELEGALARLLAIVENYPQLKANETFNRLMDELAGTENRIAVARMRYNETVREYNMTIKKFPTNIIANMFGFREQPYFEAQKGAEEAPKVKF
ncbi:MAG: LemA family protein [Candidatus Hydrothermae bacterium]|uniref:LemA family protein n=1 Tax=candidate division WOR-3 bacterium TaxID=2052148 RepID=A0A7C0XB54_UNCW3|nr:LemA family protein [Candidatus Hydrothermae bacterium]RKY96121.1 MAG: LemA family protein [Candidatus Hydrothermae bacterium]HDM90362.1 LemA family protein [candidate division WOR-3 bacterium]